MTTTCLERPANRAGTATAGERAFVTLTIAGQLCGIPVLDVRDILGERAIARIPLAPPEIAGSLNLRGRIVTAIDLRRRLSLPPALPNTPRMSIVAEQRGELYALLVDQVSEVISLRDDQFEANPATLPANWAAFSVGIYRLDGRLMVVFDVSRLLALGETSTSLPALCARGARWRHRLSRAEAK